MFLTIAPRQPPSEVVAHISGCAGAFLSFARSSRHGRFWRGFAASAVVSCLRWSDTTRGQNWYGPQASPVRSWRSGGSPLLVSVTSEVTVTRALIAHLRLLPDGNASHPQPTSLRCTWIVSDPISPGESLSGMRGSGNVTGPERHGGDFGLQMHLSTEQQARPSLVKRLPCSGLDPKSETHTRAV